MVLQKRKSYFMILLIVAAAVIVATYFVRQYLKIPDSGIGEKQVVSPPVTEQESDNAVFSEDEEILEDMKAPIPTPTTNQEQLTTSVARIAASEAMQKELERAARVFKFDINTGFTSDQLSALPPYGIETREIETADGKHLAFDITSGQLRIYYDLNHEEVPTELGKESAIAKETALRTASELLKELDIDVNLEEDNIDYQDSVEQKPGDLQGAEWVMSSILKDEGVPYFGSGVRVAISAYSGNIISYSYRPTGAPPASMEEKIDVNQASEKVTAFCAALSPSAPSVEITGAPQKAIALPNNFWTRSKGEPLTAAVESRLCWIVNAIPSGGGYPVIIYVDAETGEVCGGMD